MAQETEAANTPPAGATETTETADAPESADPWSLPVPPEHADDEAADTHTEGEPSPTEAAKAEEAKPEEKPPEKPALTEPELQAAALKYANKTMAAARRAQREIASVKADNDRLKSTAAQAAKELDDFRVEFKKNPFGAVRKLGYAGIREFIDAGIEAGEPKTETADDRVARLEARLTEERAERERIQQAANHEAAKGRVQKALEAQPEKFDAVVNTKVGQSAVWEGITEYARLHGTVPDAAVFAIAARVEAELANDIGRARKFKTAAPASKGNPVPATANGARTSGKTITNASTGGAPTTKEYSLDWDEGRKEISADMKAAGEL